MANAFLEKQKAERKAAFSVGEDVGMQRMWDAIQLTLRDPDVMGKDILGRARIEKVFYGARKVMNEYRLAFTDHAEADVKQEKLDAALREIWGDDLQTFYERYPYFKKIDYTKPIKGGNKG